MPPPAAGSQFARAAMGEGRGPAAQLPKTCCFVGKTNFRRHSTACAVWRL